MDEFWIEEFRVEDCRAVLHASVAEFHLAITVERRDGASVSLDEARRVLKTFQSSFPTPAIEPS